MDHAQRRKHFRLEYPPHERPTLRLAGVGYRVNDLSEEGLSFDHGIRGIFTTGETIRGAISFIDGVACLVRGKVVRVENSRVSVALSQGLPFARMLTEERRILHKYGKKTG